MKKNLRNILAVGLGLITTVAFAQDWNVDSRTRMDMSEANGTNNAVNTADQRVTVGTTWGGSDWGIHVSSDVNYTLGNDDAASMSIYEAYASADLMGFASVTAGRMALNNGSGALMSSNDWGANRTTWEGMAFGLNLDMADITLGYHRSNDGASDVDAGNTWINAAGNFSGWDVNLLYMTDEGQDNAATGLDISGELMGAGVSASMNTDYAENTMRVIGLTYAVNDDMGVNVAQTVYGEDGNFNMAGTNMDGSWNETGNMGYLSAGSEMLSYGITYNMSGISMGATMHNITNSMDENVDRSATEISLGYSLGGNAGLSLSMVNDDDAKYMWMTLNVGL